MRECLQREIRKWMDCLVRPRPDAGVDVMARLASQKGLTGPAIIRYMISTLEQELVLAEADALAAAGGGRVPGSKGGDPTQR
jgi:hypothetical protein